MKEIYMNVAGVYVGKDPENKPITRGDKESIISKFSFAVSRKVKGEDVTDWWNVECWDNKYVQKYVKKGVQISVRGKVQLDHWKDKETGKERTAPKIIADWGGVDIMGKRGDYDTEQAPPPATTTRQSNRRSAQPQSNEPTSNSDNDMPW